MRILGKLGGRNRRFLQLPPVLEYHATNTPQISLQLNGTLERVALQPAIDLALAQVEDSDATFHRPAFEILMSAAMVLVADANDHDLRMELRRVTVGLFGAARHEGLRSDVRSFLLDLYAHVLHAEILRELPGPGGVSQRHLLPLTLVMLEAMAHAIDGLDPARLRGDACDAAAAGAHGDACACLSVLLALLRAPLAPPAGRLARHRHAGAARCAGRGLDLRPPA